MIIWIIIAGLLLVIVIWNNQRVNKDRRKRGRRNFRKKYMEKRKEQDKS